MNYYKKVIGERIYLSPINPEDIEKYTKWINDCKVSDNIAATWQLFTEYREKDFLETMAKDGYNFAIVRQEDDQLLGNVSFFNIHQIHRNAECGIFIGDEENRGKGYGREALKLLLRYGFHTLNLNNVVLRVFSFNDKAISCYKSIGFKIIGERRNAYFVRGQYHNEIFMDILAEEFTDITT